jgi:hypothetical protein
MQAQILPRKFLQQTEVEKFKELMIQAIMEGEVITNPAIFKLKTATFMTRFADAKLGYKRFQYPFPYDLVLVGNLKVYEMSDGNVLIRYPEHEKFKVKAPTQSSRVAEIGKRLDEMEQSGQDGLPEYVELVKEQAQLLKKMAGLS